MRMSSIPCKMLFPGLASLTLFIALQKVEVNFADIFFLLLIPYHV